LTRIRLLKSKEASILLHLGGDHGSGRARRSAARCGQHSGRDGYKYIRTNFFEFIL